MIIVEIKIIIVITMKYAVPTVHRNGRPRMYNGPSELIHKNGSRRKVLTASVMEIQVIYVKARGVRYIY